MNPLLDYTGLRFACKCINISLLHTLLASLLPVTDNPLIYVLPDSEKLASAAAALLSINEVA